MEYVYSAMVLHAAKKPVSEDGITNVLKAAGVTPDAARVKALIAALEGVNIDEAIATAVAAPVDDSTSSRKQKSNRIASTSATTMSSEFAETEEGDTLRWVQPVAGNRYHELRSPKG